MSASPPRAARKFSLKTPPAPRQPAGVAAAARARELALGDESMRVLFFTGQSASDPLPTALGDDVIVCGPAWPDACADDGRVRSLRTPAGEYDIAALAGRLPPGQKPDVVVCQVDASWTSVPRNLAAFRVPRVLLIGGTHHGHSPLTGMMRYVAEERPDRIVFLQDRHHAGFFQAAGFKNIFWFPGLTFPHRDAAVFAARQSRRDPHLACAATLSDECPRAARLLDALAARKLPLATRPLPQAEALGFFGGSLLAFHASRNGELGLRALEILASGAGLITDRLAPESGFDQLFLEDHELAAYGDAAELATVVAQYLAHPDEARELGETGARWFDLHLGEARRGVGFRRLAFEGVVPPEFEFSPREAARMFFEGDADRLWASLIVYEDVQELHRTQESVHVALDRNAPDDLVAIYSTLPRVGLSRIAEGYAADMMLFSRLQPGAAVPDNAARLWCYDAEPDDLARLEARFASAGFAAIGRAPAVFDRRVSAAPGVPASERLAS